MNVVRTSADCRIKCGVSTLFGGDSGERTDQLQRSTDENAVSGELPHNIEGNITLPQVAVEVLMRLGLMLVGSVREPRQVLTEPKERFPPLRAWRSCNSTT